MARIQILLVAVGRKGVGKTVETNKVISQYILGNPVSGVPGRRVLILDVNNEYEGIKTMPLKRVRAFSEYPIIEARRIVPFHDNGTAMTMNEVAETLFTILQNYRNGMLVIEDPSRYLSDNLPNDVIGAICTNRHVNLDIIMHYQSISRITPKIWQNINILRFHPITDSIVSTKDKLGEKKEMFHIAEKILNKACEIDKYFHLYVDVENSKILGKITVKMRDDGIMEYLSMFYKRLINPKIGQINPYNRKNKYTEEEVIKEETQRIIKAYF